MWAAPSAAEHISLEAECLENCYSPVFLRKIWGAIEQRKKTIAGSPDSIGRITAVKTAK